MAINKEVSLGRIGFVIEGDFDSTKAYKKLSVVKVPSTGSVYISKTNVPANTSIGNENYWLNVFNGEINNIGLRSVKLPQLSTLSDLEYVNVIEISSSIKEYNLFVTVCGDIDDIDNPEGELYGATREDKKKVWVYNSVTRQYISIYDDITTLNSNDILITEVNENNNTHNTSVIRSSVLENINNGELSSRINGFIIHAIPSFTNDAKTLKLSIGNKIDIATIGGILFKVPDYRDAFDRILINNDDDELITTLTLTQDLLFAGDIYIITPTIVDRVWTSSKLRLLHRNDKVINSKAYVAIDQNGIFVINGFSNIRTTALDNYEYIFDCINTECNIDLFSMIGLDDGVGGADELDVLNSETYNALVFTEKLKFIFHIANYYKNQDTTGGKYNKGTGHDRGVGSYFSGQKVFNENNLRMSIPQFWGRTELNLTRFIIPRNTKFSIMLLPMLNCVDGTIDSDANVTYSMIILFDDFESVAKYNNNGQVVIPTDRSSDVVAANIDERVAEMSASVTNNPSYEYVASIEPYIRNIS